MKIQKILKRLLQLHPKSIDLSLDRIKRLLKDLNKPQNKIINAIQVVGTNGKFSCSSGIREIFETAGYTVNLNTSPSIRKFNERFYILGKYISDDRLFNLLTEVEEINQGRNITFHEFISACFFLEASRNKADINILEAGLFFRLDAGNVLEKNIASVVMPIGMDHKNFLKKGTINEIVYEKCSQLLNNSKIFVSEQNFSVLKQIKKNIINNSSEKIIFGENYNYYKNGKNFIFEDKFGKMNLPLPNLLGNHQISNVSTAIAAARSLEQFNIKDGHIRKAITKIRSEGRLQNITKGNLRSLVSKNNIILIDGAHNVLAAKVVKKYLKSLNTKRKIIMVLAMMKNKEHKKFILIFKNIIHSVITLNIPNQINFIKKEKLSKVAKSCNVLSKTEISIENALKNIAKEDNDAIILCTGSLYFAGEILNLN